MMVIIVFRWWPIFRAKELCVVFACGEGKQRGMKRGGWKERDRGPGEKK
jgi:hypothetical protein